MAKFFLIALILVVSFLVSYPAAAQTPDAPGSFRIQPGDRLTISIYREEDISGSYEIDPSGILAFPLIGEVKVSGLTPNEVRELLVNRLSEYLVRPQLSVRTEESAMKSISVLGNVNKPGTFNYLPGSTLMRLISDAGGFSRAADKKNIRIVRNPGSEEKQVIVVNSLDIINGHIEDPRLEPNDMVFVAESIF